MNVQDRPEDIESPSNAQSVHFDFRKSLSDNESIINMIYKS